MSILMVDVYQNRIEKQCIYRSLIMNFKYIFARIDFPIPNFQIKG